jgi:small subunit ribosomal protein S1
MEIQTQDKTSKKQFLRKPKTLFEEILKSDVSPNLPKLGDIITGHVAAREGSKLYVNLGALKSGIIYGAEFYNAKELIKDLEIGDQVTAKVVDIENEDGYIELSLTGSLQDLSWQHLMELKDSKEVVTVKIDSANKGGLIAQLENQQAFLPVSQLTTEHYPRVEEGDKEKILEELKKLVGAEIKVRVIDADPAESKLIISEREAQNEKLQEILGNYKIGDIIEGEVSGVVDFGIFVKFQPKADQASPDQSSNKAMEMEGLVHISELDWQLIEHPRDVVELSQKVKAKIISIDNGRISLSLKALKENPWANVLDKYKPEQIIEGKLMKFNPFGAFIRLDDEIHGLVHISEFGSEEKMHEAIQPDKTYQFKILSIEPTEYRMALALVKNEQELKQEQDQTLENKEIPTTPNQTESQAEELAPETKQIEENKS